MIEDAMTDYQKLAEHKNNYADNRRAKNLRQLSSPAERLLWGELRLQSKNGLKFRRQHPISPYIVDFICLAHRLIIEIDGESHNSRQDYDRERDNYLQAQGYRILRFTNEDVYCNRQGVVQTILHAALTVETFCTPPLTQPRPRLFAEPARGGEFDST